MEVTVVPTEDRELINSLVFHEDFQDPRISEAQDILIAKSGFGQATRDSKYLVIYADSVIAGFFKYEPVTNMCLFWHIKILKAFWGTGVSDKASELGDKFIKENTPYRKLLVTSPIECKEVHKACCERGGFEVEGVLTNAIYFNDKIQHLIILGKDL